MKHVTSQRFNGLTPLLMVLIISISLQAQVGIGTTDPKTMLDVNGAISLREGPALSLMNGINNDISLGSSVYSMYRIIGPTADFSITGIVPVASVDGQVIVLQNTTDYDITIKHNYAGSAAANRIYAPGERDYYLTGKYTTLTFHYSKTLACWVLENQLNHIETWYHGPVTVANGYNTYTAIIPEATFASSVSVNFMGNIDSTAAQSLIIEFIESRNGEVLFRILNNSSALSGVTFNITINKI
jgi:hypothetical protein